MANVKEPGLMILIALSTLVFVGLLVVTFFAGNPSQSNGLFLRGIVNVSDMHPVDITPASEIFTICGVIYAWQVVILLYCISTICRHISEVPVYIHPVLLPKFFYVCYISNILCNILWLFVWDRLFLSVASMFLILMAVTSYICLIISFQRLNEYRPMLVDSGRRLEMWLIVVLVQNGLAAYAVWTTIASLLNIAIALAYSALPAAGEDIASGIALGLLSLELLFYVGTDLTVFSKFSQFVFTPYVVVIVALIGIIAKNWNPKSPNSICTAVLLGVSVLCFLLKICQMLLRVLPDRIKCDHNTNNEEWLKKSILNTS